MHRHFVGWGRLYRVRVWRNSQSISSIISLIHPLSVYVHVSVLFKSNIYKWLFLFQTKVYMSRFKKKKDNKLPYRRSERNYKCIYEICTQNENLFNPIILLIRREAVILSSRFISRTLIINSSTYFLFPFLTHYFCMLCKKYIACLFIYGSFFSSTSYRIISCRQN